MHPDSN
jgi:hypothetical protein